MTIYAPPCGLARRLAAIIYDGILLVAIILLASLPVVFLLGGATNGDFWFTLYILAIGYAYFAGFWIQGGQTLGMRTWRVVIIREEGGGQPNWKLCLVRYIVALIGWIPLAAGFLWSLFDAEQRTLHDIASGTCLVVLPREGPSEDSA